MKKQQVFDGIKKGMKLSLKSSFWLFFGFFILIAGMTKGIGLAITLSILFGAGYWTIKKVTKFFIRKGRLDAESRQNKSIEGIN